MGKRRVGHGSENTNGQGRWAYAPGAPGACAVRLTSARPVKSRVDAAVYQDTGDGWRPLEVCGKQLPQADQDYQPANLPA